MNKTMKEFEVELKATTYRTFYISGTWKDEARVSSIEPKNE
jgi:hypothetical protein